MNQFYHVDIILHLGLLILLSCDLVFSPTHMAQNGFLHCLNRRKTGTKICEVKFNERTIAYNQLLNIGNGRSAEMDVKYCEIEVNERVMTPKTVKLMHLKRNLKERNVGNCHTPDGKRGRCINIQKCRSLLSILQSNRRPSPADIEFLRRSHCGFEGKNPLVCCPLNTHESTAPDFQPTLQLPIHSGAKDVSRHPGVAQFLPEQCGFFTEEKITGGNATGLFEFPWMALLGYNTRNGLQYRCGGSLINIRYVLTAAHCIKTSNELQLSQVRLGEYNLNTDIDCQVDAGCAPPVQDFGIEEAIAHPNYFRADVRNDIGLIRLNRNAILTDSVSPICLPIGKAQQERSLEGEKLTVTGWGATENGLYSPVLQKVKVPVMPLQKCVEVYSKLVRITEKQICAGGVDIRDSCNGDSGGPLQSVGRTVFGDFNYIQFGIVSFGPITCGVRERPGVYTRVGYYMDWILDNFRY